MTFNEYLTSEALILIPVLYVIGMLLKNTQKISDKYIPIILLVCGISMKLAQASLFLEQNNFLVKLKYIYNFMITSLALILHNIYLLLQIANRNLYYLFSKFYIDNSKHP